MWATAVFSQQEYPMPRTPRSTDFEVPVEGIGTFVFARRTLDDEFALQREYARLIDGVKPTDWLATMAGWMAALRTLTVRAPEGWNLDAMDPLDNGTYKTLFKVYTALRDKEGSFRTGLAAQSQAVSA